MYSETEEKLIHTPGRFERLGGLFPVEGCLVTDAVMQGVLGVPEH
jgi:hypothetical protein